LEPQPQAILCVCGPDGHFMLMASTSSSNVSVPTPQMQSVQSSSFSVASKPLQVGDSNDVEIWDGWPNGPIEQDFTHDQFTKTKRLMVHWASKLNGRYRAGPLDVNAETWGNGKKTCCVCLGIMRYTNPDCRIIVRPNITINAIDHQLQTLCPCGSKILQPIASHVWKMKISKYRLMQVLLVNISGDWMPEIISIGARILAYCRIGTLGIHP